MLPQPTGSWQQGELKNEHIYCEAVWAILSKTCQYRVKSILFPFKTFGEV